MGGCHFPILQKWKAPFLHINEMGGRHFRRISMKLAMAFDWLAGWLAVAEMGVHTFAGEFG